MPKKILVTGINGFVGRHLARELHAQGYGVLGIGRDDTAHPEIAEFIGSYFVCDLTDKESVSQIPLDDVSAIISLAGLAKVGDSFKDPEKYQKVNVEVLSNLCEKLLSDRLSPRVFAISTGAVYDPDQPMPLTESSRLTKQGSPYGTSKKLMEEAALGFVQRGLDCVIARPFNHSGPGQEPGFLIPDLYNKIMEGYNNSTPVKVGNLHTKRDYTDVRDIVRAYVSLLAAPKLNFDTYNVCSNTSRSGETILQLLLQATELEGKITVEEDSSMIRPDDPAELYGSHERLKNETGWQPATPFEQTIRDFVASQPGG